MKRIGLIGGLSPASTAHYYEILCGEYNREFGELNFPEMTIQSLNLQHLIRLFDTNDWDGVAAILLDALHRLQSAGADFAAILANTPHNAYEQIRERSPIAILTIMDATSAALRRDNRRKVALLGTRARQWSTASFRSIFNRTTSRHLYRMNHSVRNSITLFGRSCPMA